MAAEPWELKDTLRQMTEKFNNAVEEIKNLQTSSTEVNEATTERLSELQNYVNTELSGIQRKLNQKIESVSAEDIGLDKVNNTSDVDKPVSTAQREAIDAALQTALNASSGQLTSEEIDNVEIESNGDDPEVSAPVKAYINERIQELAAQSGVASYGIASKTVSGVVRASDDVQVNSQTGAMSVPALSGIQSRLEQSIQGNAEVARQVGNISGLNTEEKSTLVGAINEIVQKLSELDDALHTLDASDD